MTDRQLLAEYVESGSEPAFAEIVARHADLVYSACLRVLAEAHAAEDAAQATFLLLTRKARSLPAGVVLSGWLYRAAAGVARNARKARFRRERREREAGAMRKAAPGAGWGQVAPRLEAALESLPRAQRDALVLRHMRGLSQAEAAREMGCPPKTLDTRVTRGLARLRAWFGRRGLGLSAAGLAGLIEGGAVLPAPAGLAAKFQAACLGSAAASPAALGMLEVFMKTLMWTKIKVTAGLLAAAGVLAVSAPAVYRAVAADGGAGRNAGPTRAAPARPPAEKPFVPKGGKITAKAKLPGRLKALHWSPDDGRLLFAFKDEAYRFALATGKTDKIFPGCGKLLGWLAGGRVLSEAGSRLCLWSPGGGKREVTGLAGTPWGLKISPDGKFAAVPTRAKRSQPSADGMFLVSAEGGKVRELKPPVGKPADPARRLMFRTSGWSADGRLRLETSWIGEKDMRFPWSYFGLKWTPWDYDPASGKFRKLGEAKRRNMTVIIGRELALPGGGEIRRVLAEGAPPLPGGFRPAPKGGPKAPPPRPGTAKVKSGPAAALEILDAAGKVSKRIELDRKALGGADLWPRCVSADGNYLLAATYREMTFHAGAPASVWEPVAEKHVLMDLRTGRFLPGFKMPDVGVGRRTAVMAPSREVLLIPGTFRNPKGGIWAVSFDGGHRNLAPAKGLPDGWADSETAFYGQGPLGRAPSGWNRLAMTTRAGRYVKAPGPRQLLVFWNSAKPIRAWVSKGVADQPENLTWSRGGRLLAFTAGGMLYVWGPTAGPGEPKLPGERKPEVF